MSAEMRRKDRQTSQEEALRILTAGEYGVLSTVGEDNLPSGVPLSFVVRQDFIYFHCAMQGEKISNMRKNPRVSFVVVGKTQPIYAKNFTTYYESAVAQGTAVCIEDSQEKILALRLICEKYLPEHMDKFDKAIEQSLARTGIWRIAIERLTGKAKG